MGTLGSQVLQILLFAFLYTGAASVPFTIVPLLINVVRNVLKLGVLEKKRAETIATWNTIIVWIVVAYLTYRAGYDPAYSDLPFMLYYCINRTILKGEVCLNAYEDTPESTDNTDVASESKDVSNFAVNQNEASRSDCNESSIADKYCRNCGNKLSEDSLYCSKCGSSVVRMKSNGQPADIYVVGSEENTMNDRRS